VFKTKWRRSMLKVTHMRNYRKSIVTLCMESVASSVGVSLFYFTFCCEKQN